MRNFRERFILELAIIAYVALICIGTYNIVSSISH